VTQGLVTGLVAGRTSITASLCGVSGSTTDTVTAATLTSIEITPPNPSIAKGTRIQLSAIGTFSDGTTQDLTSQVSGTSSNPGIVVPNPSVAKGLVTGTAVGSTVITATLNGIQGSTTVTVTSAVLTSITITPPNPSIAKGTTVQLIATGNYTDGSTQDLTSQVSWTSGDNTIAQVSGALGTIGLVTGLNMGSTSIAATLNGISGSTTVMVTVPTLVSIIVTPANQTVSAGTTLMMTATAVFSDGTMQNVTAQADWTSSDENVAHIISSGSPNTNGRLMAKKPGTTTITATIPSLGNAHGSTVVTVT
jgi:trimeric autotransporter adhesin